MRILKDKELVDMAEHLVPISDFSKGKTAKVIEKVAESDQKYVILKNNQPKAMLVSLKHFKDIAQKAEKFETLIEKIEEYRLVMLAEKELKNYDTDKSITFEEVLKEFSLKKDEIDKEIDKVEIE